MSPVRVAAGRSFVLAPNAIPAVVKCDGRAKEKRFSVGLLLSTFLCIVASRAPVCAFIPILL